MEINILGLSALIVFLTFVAYNLGIHARKLSNLEKLNKIKKDFFGSKAVNEETNPRELLRKMIKELNNPPKIKKRIPLKTSHINRMKFLEKEIEKQKSKELELNTEIKQFWILVRKEYNLKSEPILTLSDDGKEIIVKEATLMDILK